MLKRCSLHLYQKTAKSVMELSNSVLQKPLKLSQFCVFSKMQTFVASLRLKNERGERPSSNRSDHVTGVWEGLHNLCNVQRIFPHLLQFFMLVQVRLLQLGLFFVRVFYS